MSALPPLVSVVIPVLDGERYISAAVWSVLSQEVDRVEIIVVDDGSTDRTVPIAVETGGSRCRVVCQSHAGAAAARNLGVSHATGRLLAFLDADDVWMEGKLERQIEAIGGDPELDAVFGHYVAIDAHGTRVGADDARPGYSLGTMLIRRERFLAVGPLSSAWRVGEFIDWFARAEEAGLRHAMLPDVLLGRRVHGANLTSSARDARGDYARIVAAAAARRGRLRAREDGKEPPWAS